jgi:hypothetical protein
MEIQFTIKLVGSGGNAAVPKKDQGAAKKDEETPDKHSLPKSFEKPAEQPAESPKNPLVP